MNIPKHITRIRTSVCVYLIGELGENLNKENLDAVEIKKINFTYGRNCLVLIDLHDKGQVKVPLASWILFYTFHLLKKKTCNNILIMEF